MSYSDAHTYAVPEVNPEIKSGSSGKQTNSAAAPVCSYKEPQANPEKKRKIMHSCWFPFLKTHTCILLI